LGKFEKHQPTIFQIYISYIKMSFKQLENHSQLLCGRDGSVGWASGCYAGGREFDSDWTNTQGLKITEAKVLPL